MAPQHRRYRPSGVSVRLHPLLYLPTQPFANQSQSVAGLLHGVNHFFAARGLFFPISHPQVRMLLGGPHHLDNPEHRKTLVSLDLLRAVFARLDLSAPVDQALWGFCVFRSSFCFANQRTSHDGYRFEMFALLHDEIVARDAHDKETSFMQLAMSVSIRLVGSMTSQNGPAVVRSLNKSGDKSTFPVLGALCLRRTHGNLPDT